MNDELQNDEPMKSTTLLIDHHQNTDKGVIVHKAGTAVDLPAADVEYINFAIVEVRKEHLAQAAKIPGSPEYLAAAAEQEIPPQQELVPAVSNTP
jgi:hypothetical protein